MNINFLLNTSKFILLVKKTLQFICLKLNHFYSVSAAVIFAHVSEKCVLDDGTQQPNVAVIV